jgi:outer membrane protein OmpA-like peptidoglycan-associated protein
MKPESMEALEKLYSVLKNNPNLKISIEGHVCCVRDAPDALDIDTYEPHLSVNRAKAIYNYLVEKGIDPGRLTYVGYGRRRPVIEVEQSEEDAEKNRRVEIRITDNK